MKFPLLVSLVAACLFSLVAFASQASATVTPSLNATYSTTVMGAHPDITQSITFGYNPAPTRADNGEDVKRLIIDLPAGLIGNPNAVSAANRCTEDYTGANPQYDNCDAVPSSQVGTVSASAKAFLSFIIVPFNCDFNASGKIYILRNRPNADPEVPTRLGIRIAGTPSGGFLGACGLVGEQEINLTAEITLRPEDNGLRIRVLQDLPRDQVTALGTAQINIESMTQSIRGMAGSFTGTTADDFPFLTNATRKDAWTSKVYTTGYDGNNTPANQNADVDPIDGTNDTIVGSSSVNPNQTVAAPYNPSFSITQSNQYAGAPVGLRAVLDNPVVTTNVPQPAYAKFFQMTLPRGFRVNPAVANKVGSIGCHEWAFLQPILNASNNPVPGGGVRDNPPGNFTDRNNVLYTCPSASEVGTVAVAVPELTGDLIGKVYLGAPRPGDEAAGIYRLYIFASRGGVAVKLQGRASADPTTGQITVLIDNSSSYTLGNPQFNYSKFTLDFNTNSAGVGFGPTGGAVSNPVFGGNDAQQLLVNPQVCGTYSANDPTVQASNAAAKATLTPWTGESDNVSYKTMTVVAPPGGSCDYGPFTPSFSANVSDTGAGKHPDLNLTVTRPDRTDNLRDMVFTLPNGFGGSATAAPTCAPADITANTCAASTQVGTVNVQAGSGSSVVSLAGTVRMADPDPGDTAKLAIIVPAVVGPFNLGNVVIYNKLTIANSFNFRLRSTTSNMPQAIRGIPILYRSIALNLNGIVSGKPFLQNPSKCSPMNFQGSFTSNGDLSGSLPSGSGSVQTYVTTDSDQSTTGCASQPFNPTTTVTPTSTESAKPTNLTLGVTIPQTTSGVTGSTIQHSTLDRMQLTFPAGMEFNPAFASSITACPTATINTDITNLTSSCSASAEVANVTVNTPLLGSPVNGKVYLEEPGSTEATRFRFALYLPIPGGMQIVRGTSNVNGDSDLPGGLGSKDTGTGQISIDFPGLPDVPYASLSVAFSGSTPMLVNPDTCATQNFAYTLTPTNLSLSPVARNSSYVTSYNGSGSACPAQDPWNPTFATSVSTTVANAHPNLTMTVTRPDKNQYLRDMSFSLPAGLTGAPTAAPTCSQALADAANCPASSQIGTLQAQVGSGTSNATLSGVLHNTVAPSNAPAKFTAILNVNLGPFNLGKLSIPVNVALRSGDYGLDVSVANLPSRYEGIRVRYRQVDVNIAGMATQGTGGTGDDQPFLNNPSKCGLNTFNASLTSSLNNSVARSSSYTTTGCPLNFGTNPTFSATPTTTESQAPTGLTVNVASAAGNPTISRVRVQMPAGMTINPAVGNNGLNATCATAVIDAGGSGCPAQSDVGDVSIQTPLLAGTFTGNVYLENPGSTAATRYKLAVVVALPGQNLILRGSTTVDGSTDGAPSGTGASDSGTGQIVADFTNIPDLAFSDMTLSLAGGPRALLINPVGCASQTVNGQITPSSGGSTVSVNSNYSTTLDCSPGFTPSFSAALATTESGASGDLTLSVSNPGKSRQLREFNVHLPVGLVADPVATPRCSQVDAAAGNCLPANAVGTVTTAIGNAGETLSLSGTIYNVDANPSEPARLQAVIPVVVGPFNLGKLSVPITTQLRPDLGIDTETTLPTKYEGIEVRVRSFSATLLGTVGGNDFMINPSKCGATSIDADMVSADAVTVAGSQATSITGCPKDFTSAPTLNVTPSTTETAKPVGLTFDIGSTASNPTIQQIAMTFPEGLEINPAVANGPLTACSTADIDAGGAACVGSGSQLGTVALDTPLLPGTRNGYVFLETPGSTASTRYKIALVVPLPGADMIVRGAVNVNGSSTITPGGSGSKDSGTGQITTVFSGVPDLSFTNITVAFDSGPQAMFANKRECASTDFSADFTPQSGGAVSNATDSYTTDSDCATSFAPTFTGGVSTGAAAGNPDLDLNFARPEKDKNLRDLTVSLPTGLVAATTATTRCPQATAATGNCDPGQAVGSVTAAIGTGTESLSLTGSVYNVQPDASEPARFSVKMPVVVGPFDLGNLTVPISTSLRPDFGVDATAQLPVRYEGIAARIRSLNIELAGQVGGNDFVINPSKCQSNAVGASMTSDGVSPDTVTDSWNFTTTGCPSTFGTAPTIQVTPSTTAAGTPVGMTIAVNSSANNPTIKRVQLTMPQGLEVNPAFANGLNACSTANVNAGTCNPADAVADVTMNTHLLGSNPTGKVYLETPGTTASDRYKLAMILDLPGRKMIVRGAVNLNGSTTIAPGGKGSVDTGTGQISADFDNIPDLGFTTLTMAFNSGSRAMLVNPASCSAATFQGTLTPHTAGAPATPTAAYTPTGCSNDFDPAFTASLSSTQAAGNPDLTLTVDNVDRHEQLRDLTVQLPVGLVANTTATPTRCSQVNATAGNCLAAEEVGTFSTAIGSGPETYSLTGGKIYNVVPSSNEPARMQAVIDVNVGPFALGKLSIPINTSLRSDYGVNAVTQLPLRYEGIAVRIRQMQIQLNGTVGGQPFMVNPSKCQSHTITGQMTSDQSQVETDNSSFTTTGCAALAAAYSPSISASVNPNTAGNPTALTFGVNLPAGSSTTNRVQMTLPEGMEISPGVGSGLVACSASQIDAGGNDCLLTTAKLGTISLTTPLLPGVQTGEVFLETPGSTATDRYKLALVIHLPGRDLILRGGTLVNGSSDLTGDLGSKDTGTGQVTADFPNLPDLGFTNMTVAFDASGRKLLVNPKSCTTHTVAASLTPNSGATAVTPTATFSTVNGSCDVASFGPAFTGSLSTTLSGSNPNLNLQVTNPNGSQELKKLDVTLPEGLVAYTTGVPRCSQVDAAAGNCIPAQTVGSVSASIGSGSETLSLPGTIYNVTPSSNQPARLQVVMPVQVGPFDLGKLSIPVPLTLNPDFTVTGSATLPSRYEGIAVRLRQLNMQVLGEPNGNKFLIAPSKCGIKTVGATMTSDASNSATGSFNVNITGCPTNFGTSPAFQVTPSTTQRSAPVDLTFRVTSNANNPTIGNVSVAMPSGLEINPGFGTSVQACPTASIDAGGDTCPAQSQVATASLKTQLLDPANTYTGKVFLEAPGATAATRFKVALIVKLPGADLIVRGQVLVNGSSDLTGGLGSKDTGTGQITASFSNMPDLGFTELEMVFGGTTPMLVNPRTCSANTFTATITPSSGGTAATPTSAYTTTPAGCSTPSFASSTSFTASVDDTTAGAHPNLTLTFGRSDDSAESLRGFDLELPVGLAASTSATDYCSQVNAAAGNCTSDEQVGQFSTTIGSGATGLDLSGQIYNVEPDDNEPAQLAAVSNVVVGPYDLGKLVIPIHTSLRADLGVDTTTVVPTRYEGIAVRLKTMEIELFGEAGPQNKPFVVNPSKCQSNTITAKLTPAVGAQVSKTSSFTTTDCANVPYNGAVEADLSTTEIGKPVGLDLAFTFNGNSSSTKRVSTVFPEGMGINPGVGNYGSGMTCAPADVAAGGSACPAASKLGDVSLETPLLPTPQTGAAYLETPGTTAATRYKVGIFIDLPGSNDFVVHGSVQVDGSSDVVGGLGAKDTGTGQVTATFDDLPDLQFSRLEIDFKTTGGSDHALLTNPMTCGSFDVTANMTPWSRPTQSEAFTDSFTTSYDGSGGACPGTQSQDPSVTAELGDNNPSGPAYAAGASADLKLTVRRPDKDKGIRNAKILLPPGLVGAPAAAPTCAQAVADAGNCESATPGSRIGDVDLKVGDSSDTFALTGGIYNTVAPSNRPAKFTFIADVEVGPFDFGKIVVPVDVNLDNNDYSIFAETGNLPQVFEGIPVRISEMVMNLNAIADQGTPSISDDEIFLTNPRSCSTTLSVRAEITAPDDNTVEVSGPLAGPFTGCSSLNLNDNTVTIENVNKDAEQPTALNVEVTQGTSSTQATMKDFGIDLPGFRLNAPAADGLAACSASQLDSQTCPANSQVGIAWIDTQLLAQDQVNPDNGSDPNLHSLWGKVYLETPGNAPDGSDRYKLAVQLSGKTLITIRGFARIDENTGEISTDFTGLPDIPFTKFRVELTGATNPLLLNPEGTVGAASQVTAVSTLSAWAGGTPRTINQQLDVNAATAKTFAPTTDVDLTTYQSGAHPDATFTIARADGQHDIKDVSMKLPAGFLGSANASSLCPLASASAGTCAASAKIGSVKATIGQAGQTLELPGEIFMTVGAGNDIAGMSIKVPAIAGPYNLGDFITQGRILIRPSDHGITVDFEDVPKMFKGVPTHIQELEIKMPGMIGSKPFLYNASNCSPFTIANTITPYTGSDVINNIAYQATGCPARTFNPGISFAAIGGGVGNPPAWTIKMGSQPGDSTLSGTVVTLPSAITVNVAGLGSACTADQAAARNCPEAAKIGTVSVNTPLLATPVIGTVYMARSITGASLPDLLLEIPAPIDMQIRGANQFTGTDFDQIQSTFTGLPDLIFTDLTMSIAGGPTGLIMLRSGGVCAPASANFTSHSGQQVSTAGTITGIDSACAPKPECVAPIVKVKTKGVKKKANKKLTTSLSMTAGASCKAIKSVRVTYPKGSKFNKKLVTFSKKKKATKKNLKNLTGKAGTKKLKSDAFKVSKNRLSFKAAFPEGTRSFSVATKNSALMLPAKTFCTGLKGKKLKKCKKKKVTFVFDVTNVDGSTYRYNFVTTAGAKFFK